MVLTLHCIAALVQLLAVVLAVRSIKTTGVQASWLLLSAALLLMLVHRLITIAGYYSSEFQGYWGTVGSASVALGISLLFLLGMYQTENWFLGNKRTAALLRTTNQKLEQRVAARTAELLEANTQLRRDVEDRQRTEHALRQSRELLQGILDNATAVIYVKDKDGRYILVNRQHEKLFHCSAADMTGKTDYDCFPNEMAEAFRANDLKVLAGKTPLEFEEVAPHEDGPHTYISIKFPICDAAGVPYAVGGISTDITDRTRAERGLRESEALYHSLVESLPQNIFRKDREGRFTFASQRFCTTSGKSAAEILGKTDYDFYPPALAEKYRHDDREVLAAGKPLETVESHVTPTGEKLYVHVVKTPVHGVGGEVIGTQCIFWDVTAAKRAEQRQALQHAVTRVLAEAATPRKAMPKLLQVICDGLGWEWGAVWRVDRHAQLLRCAETWYQPGTNLIAFESLCRQISFPRGIGLPGRVWAHGQPAWIADVTKDSNFPRAARAAQVGLHGALGFPILLGQDILGAVEFLSRQIHEPDPELLKVMATIGSQVGQFLERKQAEEERDRFFTLSLDMLGIAGFDGYFKRLNPAWAKVLGWTTDELMAQPYLDFVHPDDRVATLAEAQRLATGAETIAFENRYRCKDGTYRWLSWKATPLTGQKLIYAAARDITDRRQAEEEVRRS
jgi:PAS domain S-box-containing protein